MILAAWLWPFGRFIDIWNFSLIKIIFSLFYRERERESEIDRVHVFKTSKTCRALFVDDWRGTILQDDKLIKMIEIDVSIKKKNDFSRNASFVAHVTLLIQVFFFFIIKIFFWVHRVCDLAPTQWSLRAVVIFDVIFLFYFIVVLFWRLISSLFVFFFFELT